jgi:hypothetical protein
MLDDPAGRPDDPYRAAERLLERLPGSQPERSAPRQSE